MSAQASIKEAFRVNGVKVLSIKRQNKKTYCAEIEINGRCFKRFVEDPSRERGVNKQMFERSLRELRRLGEE